MRARAPGLYPLAALLLAAVPVAWLQRARLEQLGLTVAGVTAVVAVGATLPVVLTVRQGRSMPPLALRVGGGQRASVPAATLPPGGPGSRACPLSLTTTRRGHLRGLCLHLADDGVLGLLTRERHVHLPLDAVITPRWRGLPDLVAPRLGRDDSAPPTGAPVALRGADPRGTRAFRSGDEPRAVSWRATARLGRLSVREWDPPGAAGVALLVQLAPDSAAPVLPERPAGAGADGDEVLLEAVASVGLAALRAGRPVALLHARPARPEETHGHDVAPSAVLVEVHRELAVAGLLVGLAEVEPLRTSGLDALAQHAVKAAGVGGTVVLALGVGWGLWSADELLRGAETVRRGGCGLRVLVGRSPDGPVPPGAAMAFGALARVASVILASELLEPAHR